MTWQPIETAPRDGTPILIYQERACDLVDYRRDEDITLSLNIYVVRYDNDRDAWVEAAGEEYFRWEPSHWQPLPAGPTGT